MSNVESRIQQLVRRVRSIADAGLPEPIGAPGDDALGELEREVNHLIRASDARLQERLLFAVGPVVVFRWQNREGWPIEYVSPNVEQLTGYPLEDFASGRRPYASLIHETDLPQVFEEVTSNSKSGATWFVHQPYRILHADGRPLWIADYTVILRDEREVITHYFGYIMDITDQVEQMSRLRAQEQVIERMSSPVLQVGRGVLAVPVLGTLHGDRAARMTDDLLSAISRGGARTAILDLTGLLEIDTATIESLLRTSRAVGLLGCRCVLSGISPMVATLIVRLGLEAQSLTTVATLQDALELALRS
ncbi:PAS domain-containing protein [Nannocystis sp. SCPEA4]|uniref:STAS domain-containing protein n=1 Tax=Nannocystis sp. SCPEA4 TaxID=2996787 RepID=UPI00226FC264|nr:PAS domain-containing protein [Nannocystis sp. SCPEA4]MCY1059209.1 PAS domain-containing protein [Nannocystis sp. SCPEA4]